MLIRLGIMFVGWLLILVILILDPGNLIHAYGRQQALWSLEGAEAVSGATIGFNLLLFPTTDDTPPGNADGAPTVPQRAFLSSYDAYFSADPVIEIFVNDQSMSVPKERLTLLPLSVAQQSSAIDGLNAELARLGPRAAYSSIEWHTSEITEDRSSTMCFLAVNSNEGEDRSYTYQVNDGSVVRTRLAGISRESEFEHSMMLLAGIFTVISLIMGSVAIVMVLWSWVTK